LHISVKKLTRIRLFSTPPIIFGFILFALVFFFQSQAQLRILENGQKTLLGPDAGLDPDTPTRSKIDLAGNWQYSTDNENWHQVKVPGSFDYVGSILFQRKFSLSEELVNNSSFKFVAFGINYDAEIFINDVFVGRHVGGYSSFAIDVPENALQRGSENTIRISVNNRLNSRTSVPLRKQVWGWRNYAGILRDIYLLATPQLRVNNVQMSVSVDSTFQHGYISASTTISNNTVILGHPDTMSVSTVRPSYALLLQVIDRTSNSVVGQSEPQSVSVEANHDQEIKSFVTVNSPQLWSPENPALYILRAVVATAGKQGTVVDEYRMNLGFRSVQLVGNAISVNGSIISLKGIVWHEEYPGKGASLTYGEMERDVAMMKSLGVNGIRFAFHPPHPYMINLCNRYGLFCLEEIPVWNVPGDILGSESYQVVVEGMIREMVQRDQASPSVIAWGLGNEYDSSTDDAVRFVDRAMQEFHSLDSRPVYSGTQMLATDKCSGHVDIAALDIAPMDLKSFKSLLTSWKVTHPVQPVILLSYGKEVEHNNTQGWYDPLSQQAQARFFLLHYAAIRDAGIAGSFVSSFADWRGDRPILSVNVQDPYVYPVGLVSERREKRLAFDMVRSQYGDEKTAALPPGSQKTSFPVAPVVSGLFVILLLGYEYAYNHRFSDAFKRALMRSYNFYSDLRDFKTISIVQTAILSVLISVTLAVLFSSIFYHYRTDRLFDFVLTYIVVSDSLKEIVIQATWNPMQGIVFFSFFFFVLMLAVLAIIKICSLVVRTKVRWYHAYGVTVWSALPIVFLSPLAMSLFKVLENPLYVIPSMAVIILILLWTLSRMISGISIVYDVRPLNAIIGSLLVLGLLIGGISFYYESAFAISSSLKFALDISRGLG
jgi:beta-glucuronidase